MYQRVVFDQSKVDEITDRLLPQPGRILSGQKRQEILLGMTTEITGLIVPVDQKEAIITLGSIGDTLDAALPPTRSILSRASRVDVQNSIAHLVNAEIKAHNEKVDEQERAEQALQAAHALATRREAEEVTKRRSRMATLLLIAGTAVGLAVYFYFTK